MFNDTLDVREGNEKRKRAMARVAQAMLRNSQRAAGVASVSRAGGGLGRQNAARFRPLAARNLGALGRLAQGGRADMAQAIGRFGVTERMPGAFDPGAIPDLGGVDATATTGVGAASGVPSESGGDAGFFDGGDALPGSDSGSQTAPPGHPDYGMEFENGLPTYTSTGPQQTGTQPGPPAPPGYVSWQGQLIPIAVWKTMQSTGELF